MSKHAVWLMTLVLPVALLACGDDEQTGDTTTVTSTTVTSTTVAPTTSTAPSTTIPGAADLEPDGVLLGALILIAGDAEAAVASGVVAPDELDAAAQALENGTLQQWVTAASQTLGG